MIVAQYLGARDKKSVSDAVHTSLVIAGILGIVLTVAGIVLSRQLLEWMKTPEEVMEQAVTYFRLYSAGMFFGIVYNMAAGILNAAGNSKRSLLYLAVASFTNIILDILFIAILDMGVAGAAIAEDGTPYGMAVRLCDSKKRSLEPYKRSYVSTEEFIVYGVDPGTYYIEVKNQSYYSLWRRQ